MATLSRGALHTPLCDLLGIRYPVCQAGMAFVARSALAAAVSEAGGLGVLAAAHCTPAELRAEIRRGPRSHRPALRRGHPVRDRPRRGRRGRAVPPTACAAGST